MVKPELEETMDKIKNRQNNNERLPDGIKKCPFQSSFAHDVPCTNECALYRSGKQMGYQCPMTELTQMAWVMKGSPRRGQRIN